MINGFGQYMWSELGCNSPLLWKNVTKGIKGRFDILCLTQTRLAIIKINRKNKIKIKTK